MANTRRLDREIRLAENKLARLRDEDSTALSMGDQAKMAGLAGVVIAKATRLKSAPMAERAAERIWTSAQERAAADLRVLQSERQQLIDQEAAARRSKKTSGWW
ncbi:hypothetical protein [Streptomyces sp. NPDC092903]|uniref:hypothetical protein n=1 Tax=Streptomyces sp. NPDC092903 TaxID=3366017 RepID=UPI0038114276